MIGYIIGVALVLIGLIILNKNGKARSTKDEDRRNQKYVASVALAAYFGTNRPESYSPSPKAAAEEVIRLLIGKRSAGAKMLLNAALRHLDRVALPPLPVTKEERLGVVTAIEVALSEF